MKLVYEFSRPATKKAELVVVQKVEIKSARAEKKPSIAQRPKTLSVAELEEKLERTRQGSPQWGYSGSSAPMAPDSFKIKPSSDLTDSAQVVISEGSLNFNSSSSTLSSYSPRSENRVIEVSESQAPGTDKSQSNHVESIAPSKAPLQPPQPQIPQSLGSAAVFPPNMIYAPVQPGPFTQPMMYPQYGILIWSTSSSTDNPRLWARLSSQLGGSAVFSARSVPIHRSTSTAPVSVPRTTGCWSGCSVSLHC